MVRVELTRCLNWNKSCWVSVSALATTGIKLTRVPRRFMISISRGLSLKRGWSSLLSHVEKENLRVTRWANKVEAGVNTKVNLFATLGLLLLSHVRFVLIVDELDNGHPRIPVVNVVSKPRRVNDGQFDLELLLFELGFDDFDFGQLVELLGVTTVVIFGRREFSREKGINERRLSQARFACECLSACRLGMLVYSPTTIMVK